VGQIGQGAILDLAPLAIGLPQQDAAVSRVLGRGTDLGQIHNDYNYPDNFDNFKIILGFIKRYY
jgi:hypothetical protein